MGDGVICQYDPSTVVLAASKSPAVLFDAALPRCAKDEIRGLVARR